MKNLKYLVALFLCSSAFIADEYRNIENTSFQAGENYKYKIKYGILTIGEAKVDVNQKVFLINKRPCYRVNVVGKTAGLASIWKVSNTYRSYVDTLAIIPQKFIYSARENNFSRDQSLDFDHANNLVFKKEKDETKRFKVPDNIQDVISGYYYLRTIDFSKMTIGQTVKAPMFFDEEIYNMQVKYAGKETIKTKFGRMKVMKLHPILPKNDLFKGEEAIRIYVSDDNNRVPVKLEIDFSFGTIEMEMNDFKNVRNKFSFS